MGCLRNITLLHFPCFNWLEVHFLLPIHPHAKSFQLMLSRPNQLNVKTNKIVHGKKFSKEKKHER